MYVAKGLLVCHKPSLHSGVIGRVISAAHNFILLECVFLISKHLLMLEKSSYHHKNENKK